jgi:hypothetical protein
MPASGTGRRPDGTAAGRPPPFAPPPLFWARGESARKPVVGQGDRIAAGAHERHAGRLEQPLQLARAACHVRRGGEHDVRRLLQPLDERLQRRRLLAGAQRAGWRPGAAWGRRQRCAARRAPPRSTARSGAGSPAGWG